MVMEVRDETCQTLLQTKVLDLAEIKSRVNFQVIFSYPLERGTGQVCLELVPLAVSSETIGMPIQLDAANVPILYPVYLN